jgi:uncharacterized protein
LGNGTASPGPGAEFIKNVKGAVMVHLGKINRLKIMHQNQYGVALVASGDGDNTEDEYVFLPNPQKEMTFEPGQFIDVFVFSNGDEQPEATLTHPRAQVGEFAFLEVADVQPVGAFLDWGLPKDLFVPFQEQIVPMTVGSCHVVAVYIDNSGRIAASSKLDRFLNNTPARYATGQQVDLLVCGPSDLGVKAIVDGKHWGLLYRNEIFEDLQSGQRKQGYIKQLRKDGKIDLTLKAPGFEKDPPVLQHILTHLAQHNGHSDITDKSSPEIIYKTYGVSKKQYKIALGMLYRRKQIMINENQICLVESPQGKSGV